MGTKSVVATALGAMVLGIGSVAVAQTYTWIDPETGQTQISNIPPPWYKQGQRGKGPRVIVNLRDRIIDDTGLESQERSRLNAESEEYIRQVREQERAANIARQQFLRKYAAEIAKQQYGPRTARDAARSARDSTETATSQREAAISRAAAAGQYSQSAYERVLKTLGPEYTASQYIRARQEYDNALANERAARDAVESAERREAQALRRQRDAERRVDREDRERRQLLNEPGR